MDEKERAETYKDWVRYEAQYNGELAHQLTDKLKKIEDDTDMKDLIVSSILDKYGRFYANDGKLDNQNRPTKETKLMLDLLRQEWYPFEPVYQKDTTLTEAYNYLADYSGLFSTMYKVEKLYGKGYDLALLGYLYSRYKYEFEPGKSVINWIKRYKSTYEEQQNELEKRENEKAVLSSFNTRYKKLEEEKRREEKEQQLNQLLDNLKPLAIKLDKLLFNLEQ